VIINKFKDTVKAHALIRNNDSIVIGVSGGPDSVALLLLLNALKKEHKLKLHIAHLDHMLRRGSSKDTAFVEKLAKKLNVPLTIAKINVKELAKTGSLEEIARNVRLAFLFKVAKDLKAKKIALGHNLDDQAETVLMRIIRGTGLYGMAGILPTRKIGNFEIIRPLIEIRRNEIESFLKKKQIRACQDPSNLDEIYFRNKIRHKLLPQLEKDFNPNIRETLSVIAQSVSQDYNYLRKQAYAAIVQMGNRINLDKFQRLHPAIQRLVLRLKITQIQGNTRRITFQHIKEIEDLIRNRPKNSIVDLPKGISVVKKGNTISFYKR